MARILLVYETFDGQTERIAERIRLQLLVAGHGVSMRRAGPAAAREIERHDAVIVGGSIRFGRHALALKGFVRQNARALSRLPNAFFTVCMAVAEPGGKPAEGNRYAERFLSSAGWRPQARAVFAGALLFRQYGAFLRLVMKLIAKMAGRATDTSRDYEYTDWGAVERFAEDFAARLPSATLSTPPRASDSPPAFPSPAAGSGSLHTASAAAGR